MAKVTLGVDLGGTNMRFGLVSGAGEVLARGWVATDADDGVDAVISRIVTGAEDLMDKAKTRGHDVTGIGIGVPGIISTGGIVRLSPNLPGWVDIKLKGMLEDRLKLPVEVENDANAYALGEYMHGAGRGAASMVCFTLGTGVGGGIILDGEVWRGADGMAGEVGHITVYPNGIKCNCGNTGCLERYSSATAVVEKTIESLSKGAKSSLAGAYRKDRASINARAIKEAAVSGDRLALWVYSGAGRALGIVAAGLINLLNIERIVVGGGMAGAWGLLEEPLVSEVDKRAFRIPAERCGIVPGTLGDDAALIGSASLAARRKG